MARASSIGLFLLLGLGACTARENKVITPSTSCPTGSLVYLGFRGKGAPPYKLWEEIQKRFPDARVYEVRDGQLGVFIKGPHDWDVRARHEEAAKTVGWTGDVVDFPEVNADCTASFHTPMPPP